MASKFVRVITQKDLKKYHEAGLLYWKPVKGDAYLTETQPWEVVFAAWECRTNWDAYVLVEE